MAVEAASTDGSVETEQDAQPRLYLHVGLPKTGTTFLQAALRTHADALAQHGFCYPSLHDGAMFHAAVEMTGSHQRWGLAPEKIDGTFSALVEHGRESGRSVIISHENFGWARPADIERIQGHLDGFQVHVLLTVRDLGRSLTAAWQERVKNGAGETFQSFTQRMVAQVPGRDDGSAVYWPSQNIEDTLHRWSALAPPERTHVVICPPSGAPRDELWKRFAAAVGIPAHVVDLGAVERVNESLGAPQVALLRQVNVAVGDRLPAPWHARIAKRWFAQKLLSRIDSQMPATPPEVAREFEEVSQRWIDSITRGGHRHYGDLTDLAIQVAPAQARHPDEVTPEEVLEGLPEVLADMLVKVRDEKVERAEQRQRSGQRVADLQRRLRRAEQRLEEVEAELRIRRRFWPFKVRTQRHPDGQ